MPLNNFGQVGDHIYRSAQPDAVGLEFCAQRLRVTVVLKLNTEAEGEEPLRPGVVVLRVPLGLHAPDDELTRRLVQTLRDYHEDGAAVLNCSPTTPPRRG